MISQKIKKNGIFLMRIYDRFCERCAYASGWIFFGMAFMISLEIVLRYFFNRPTIWVSDFIDYSMLYSTFLGSAWLLKYGGHVRLTILSERLSQRSLQVVETFNSFVGAILCGFIFWYAVKDCWEAFQKDIWIVRPLPIPKYYILSVIPFGFLLLFIQFVRDIFKFISAREARSQNG